jgi:DNA-binding MarR family transcriptional regulator
MSALRNMTEKVNEMNRLYFAIITEMLARHGFTMPQLIVLGTIKEGARTIGEISQLVDLSYSTVSGIVDRLERNGIVVRKRDEHDRRIVWVELAGKLECMEGKVPSIQDFEQLFADLSSDEIEKVTDVMTLLIGQLEKRRDVLWPKGGSFKQ